MSKVKKIGLITGGGDCPGLNAVIRAVTKTAIHDHNLEVVGILDGYEGLVMGRKMPLGYAQVKGILPKGGTILGSSNRANPFAMRFEKNGKWEAEDRSQDACNNYAAWGLDALVVVGGDGTLKIAKELKDKYKLNVVGVPKTIDNDIDSTDVTFGFDTAVITATEAVDKLHSTAESHHRVMFVELMGRDVGWISLFSGIAGGADAILIPEIPYHIDKLVKKIERREKNGSKFSIVVVSEGAVPVGGRESVIEHPDEKWELPRLGGSAQRVADQITHLMKKETRVTVLGHVQRGGSPSPYDRTLGSRFGVEAAHLAAEGKFGYMVALRGRNVEPVTLEEAVDKKKMVDPNGELVRAARSLGIDFCSAPRV
jgi:ATP-dependent phosphofructokinase / diphosphate-dependent phosphofructokinase